MPSECPHLTYRTEGDDQSFAVARAYCTVTDAFVQPMRADICNARYELNPTSDCEFYVPPTDEERSMEADGGVDYGSDPTADSLPEECE